MQKVQNRKVISRLSARIVSARGKKNLVTILAIMLTTVLFTALFTIGGSMMESIQESTMRQVGGSSMAGVKFVLPKDYEKLSKDSKVKNPSYRIIVGTAENEELLKLSTEVNYAEDENAKEMFSYPEEGSMPRERNEIATSTLVLDALGIPHTLGEKVALKISIDGKQITEDFILSGFWKGDGIAMAQQCWVSREFCDEVAPTPETSFYEQLDTKYAGYWMMDFDYSNSWDIQDKTTALLERNGYDINRIAYGVNWAYTTSDVDGGAIIFIVVLLGLILASGYLIIYNIFSLNVAGDIKSYGLLKTIGTTEVQLKKLVRRQAFFLSAIGIPIGLVTGVLLGKCLFPVIVRNFELGEIVTFSINPLVFLGAAAFSFLTVWISCNKPCKLAARVSPIEAVRYTEKTTYSKVKERKVRKVTAFSFAWANMGRNRKKVAIVVASLSLSMILMNSVYTMIQGFDMDKYVSNFIVGDAIVADATILNMGSQVYSNNEITPEVQEELKGIEGIESVHNVYFAEIGITISENAQRNLVQFVEENPQYFSDSYGENMLTMVKERNIPWNSVYGVDSWGMEQLEGYKGELDWEKFKTGNYCLVNSYGAVHGMEEPLDGMFSDVGDKLSIELLDGSVKEYEVLAIASIPYAMSSRFMTNLGIEVILPEQEFQTFVNPKGAMLSVLTREKDNAVSIDKCLENYTNQVRTNLDAVTKATYEEEFKDFVNTFWIVGGGLSLVLALIGILNFVNAVVTGILARKQELAMMEAVGMTGKQMKSMLAWEGTLYAVFTMAVSMVAVVPVNNLVLKLVVDGMWYFTNHFTIVPIILCMPVLLLAASIIPVIAYQNMKRESVVERLRETE
ncbi:MAG: ABC transporter permease [Lachnospiraceae bacterium]|nr:ABC transporter permease [Lachnospiraceae bacterium]